MHSITGPDGRCIWCGRLMEATGGFCSCSPTWVSIPERWAYDAQGNLLEHQRAWFGPARFAPPVPDMTPTVTVR